jgi:hypothetical protein
MSEEPQPSEWVEQDVDGECRIDMPMKSQIDELVIEGVGA